MQALQVSLTSYRLPLLIPALSEGSRTSGTLRVERGKIRRDFQIRDGHLVAASSTAPWEHLSQVLCDLRILDTTRAAEAFAQAEAEDAPLAQWLLDKGIVESARLMEALEHKAREALFDCYTWDSGDLWFQPDDVAPRGLDLKLKLMALHRDGEARLREWKAFREVLPSPETTFRVERQHLRFSGTAEERAIVDAAELGATVQDLLGMSREGPTAAARRVLHLFHRGALVPWKQASALSQVAAVDAQLRRAREMLKNGDCDRAAEIALRVLDQTPTPEAHELFREAETHAAKKLAKRVEELEGRLNFMPIPHPPPPELTSDDLYLHARLRGAPNLAEALRQSAMGEVAAARSLFRLMDCGAVTAAAAPKKARSGT
ncbi:MAG TPA: DUF4388 domain-containing protein [Myxococcaceae bacterium]|nr:DUF4388 domain-containing protein [Myxococcaceae bacterium]